MTNQVNRLSVAILVGAALCSVLVAGCGGQGAEKESAGVSKVARNSAGPPPPEALQAANGASPPAPANGAAPK